MDEQLKTIKPNSPRWMDCDLNCEACTDAPDCPFKRRHDEANAKADFKRKKEKKQKNKKRKAPAAAVNAREEMPRGGVPSALPSEDDEELEPTDPRNCESCPVEMDCRLGKIKDCMVQKAIRADVDWFMPFWNQQRLEHNARLPELLLLTEAQKKALRHRQTRYGIAMVRLFVVNLMKSDFANGRLGKRAPSTIDYYLDARRFPLVIQGKYNDLAPEAMKPTAADLRRMEAEKREEEQRRRREQARRIEEEEHERLERQRQEARANAAKPEELQKIWAEIGLPPLRESEKSPRERIFSKSKH